MKISHQDFEHVSVMTLSGEFTADDADAFSRVVEDRLRGKVRDAVLDCEHLEFIDSAGLEAWLDLQERLASKGGQLRLVKVDDTIAQILRVTRLDLALEAHDTVEHAVRSLR